MNNIIKTITALSLLSLSSMSLAAPNTNAMQKYEVLYTQNVDLLTQQTVHTLQEINYQRALDIYSQAKDNIAYIGARIHLHQQIALQEDESEQVQTPRIQTAE